MKFGISYNTYGAGRRGVDPDSMAAVARHAEDCGSESFYVSEHIVVYPGARAGAMEFPPDPRGQCEEISAFADRLKLG